MNRRDNLAKQNERRNAEVFSIEKKPDSPKFFWNWVSIT